MIPLLLCSLLSLVQAEDRSIFGRVLQTDGGVWVGAHVVVAAKAGSSGQELPALSVATDERGRFKLAVPQARSHLVWAHGEPDADGLVRITAARPLRPIDRRIELVEDARVPLLRLRVLGLERLAKDWCAEPRFILLGAEGLYAELRPDEAGEVTLPVWPGQQVEVQCRDQDGRVLLRKSFPTGLEDRRERVGDATARRRQFVELPLPEGLEEQMPRLDLEPFHVPPKARLRLLVVNREDGKPIAGARVLEHPGSDFHGKVRSLVTDAEGRAELEVPWRLWPWGRPTDACLYEWLVRTEGCEDRIAYYELRKQARGTGMALDDLLAGKPIELRCEMPAEVRLRGTVRLPTGLAPSGLELRVACTGPLSRSDDWIAYVRQPWRAPVLDEEGRYVLHGLGSEPEGLCFRIALDEGLWRVLGSERPGTPGPAVIQRVLPGLEDLKQDQVLPDLDLAAMVVADLELRLASGQPASFAEVDAIPPQPAFRKGADPYWLPMHVVADVRGRCRLPVPVGGMAVLLRTDEAYATLELGPGDRGLREPQVLRLTPIPRITGRVLDPDGRPRAGLRLFGRALRQDAPVGGAGKVPVLFEAMGLDMLEGRTDAEGRFDLPFLSFDGLDFVLVAYKPWSRKLPQENLTRLPPDRPGEPIEVVLGHD